jgi:hypothetical protein
MNYGNYNQNHKKSTKKKSPVNGFLGRSAGDQGFEAVEPVQFQGEPRFQLLLLASNLTAGELHLHLLLFTAAGNGICRHLNYCYGRARQELQPNDKIADKYITSQTSDQGAS